MRSSYQTFFTLRPAWSCRGSALVLAFLLVATALPMQSVSAQRTGNQPASALPNPVASNSAQQDAAMDTSSTDLELPMEPGFYDLADRFQRWASWRIRGALAELPRTTTAPRISVVILEEVAGEVQDQTQRIFQSCCTGSDPSRADERARSPSDTTAHGNLLFVVHIRVDTTGVATTRADTIGIAGDAKAFATIPRSTVERIVEQDMMKNGYVQVHAGLVALFTELGASEELIGDVSVDGKTQREANREMMLVLLFFFVVLFIPGVVVTGVFTVMESSGCLRYVLFLLSWGLITAWTIGTVIGLHGLLGEPLGEHAEGYLIVPGGVIGFVVYWIINGVMNRWLDDLSRDDYETWKHTLRGGAAVGASVGAVGNLVRSAAAKGSSGFGGFGGGGFGGGGAGGSFQAAGGAAGAVSGSGAASGAAASSAGATSAAVGSSGAVSSGAVSTASVSGGAGGSVGLFSGLSAKYRWRALRRQFRAFRWYHYITFAIVAYVFYQIAVYALWALQFEPLFWMVAVPVTIYAGIRLWDRWGPEIRERVRDRLNDDEDDPDFPGDSAIASW